MIESLYIAETGMHSQQKMLDIISNNIANASTPGFKKADVNFIDLVVAGPNNDQPLAQRQAITQGAGVRIHSTSTDFRAGGLKQTNNPFDLAINGQGFYEVINEDGSTAYSRTGSFAVNSQGFLATASGLKLAANIQLPPDAKGLVVTGSGEVMVKLGNDEPLTQLGQLELANFTNRDGLQQIGANLYRASEATGSVMVGKPGENILGTIEQGFAELSNVSMTEEMVDLMLAQRGYQLNARIIQVADQVLETINNLRR
ncbi:MAG: flagellar basal-body rod protein FlgG [Phenylobacterium sp.]|jgi:flagellar basal-body rod protein FlgG